MAGWTRNDEAIGERIGETDMNEVVVHMHEYLLKNGGIPEHIGHLVELEQQLGDKFEYRGDFDATLARIHLGLNGNSPSLLPKHEQRRLADFLRRDGKISDEELMRLGMIATPIVDALTRAQRNRLATQSSRPE